MTDLHPDDAGIASSRPNDGLGRFLAGSLRPKERLLALKELGAALWVRGRDLSDLTDRAAEVLAGSVARLPIRELDALRGQYGTDNEVVARGLVEEAATLAGWVWTTAAIFPAPPPVVHTLKVVVHSAIEIRLIGELYMLYGDPGSPRDSAWLNTVLHAWAVGHPVTTGPSSVVTARDIAGKLRHSYVSLVSDYSRVARVVHRGRDGGEAIRGLGWRFRRRLRLDPSAWTHPNDLSTMDVITTAVTDAVRGKLGLASDQASGPPRQHLDEAWSQHSQARAFAATIVPNAGNGPILARLTTALDAQEQHLRLLATKLRRPLPEAPPVPGQRQAGEAADPMTQAHAHARRADDAVDRTEDAGSRPRRLGNWPNPVRNGVVYLITSLALSAPVGWLVAAARPTGIKPSMVALLALPCCGLPLLAYGIGLLAVGWLFRPWLGGQVPRSPIIGLAISFLITSLVSLVVAVVIWS